MRRMLTGMAGATIVAFVIGTGAVLAGSQTPTPTEEPELTEPTPTEEPELQAPTPSPIVPAPFGDPAASRLLLIDGRYAIPQNEGDCGWAETRRLQVLYRDYETAEVVILGSNCAERTGLDYIFFPSSGELAQSRGNDPRLALKLVDGKVVMDRGDGCVFVESGRFTVPYGPDSEMTEIVTLGAVQPCVADYGYHYVPSTGQLTGFAPSAAAPTPTRPGVSLPNTGTGLPGNVDPAWVYFGNAVLAGAVVAGGLLLLLRRRDA